MTLLADEVDGHLQQSARLAFDEHSRPSARGCTGPIRSWLETRSSPTPRGRVRCGEPVLAWRQQTSLAPLQVLLNPAGGKRRVALEDRVGDAAVFLVAAGQPARVQLEDLGND